MGVHGALCPGLKGYVGVHGVLCPGLKGYVGVHGVLCSTRNKSQMAPNEKVCVYEKLGLRSKHRVKVFFDRRNQVFAETMKERGSMYEHFPLCGSARAAIRFSENLKFSGVFGW